MEVKNWSTVNLRLLLSIPISIRLRLRCVIGWHHNICSHWLLICNLRNLSISLGCITNRLGISYTRLSVLSLAISNSSVCLGNLSVTITIAIALHGISSISRLCIATVTSSHSLSSSIHHWHLNCNHSWSRHRRHLRVHGILLSLILSKRINHWTLGHSLHLLLQSLFLIFTDVLWIEPIFHLSQHAFILCNGILHVIVSYESCHSFIVSLTGASNVFFVTIIDHSSDRNQDK